MGKQWSSKGGGMSGRQAAREARSGWGTASGGSVNGQRRSGLFKTGKPADPKLGKHVVKTNWRGQKVVETTTKGLLGGRKVTRVVLGKDGKAAPRDAFGRVIKDKGKGKGGKK